MYVQSFLVVALCIFDVSLVTARPRERRSSTPVAVPESLNTNAKRFAVGLPPLSPLRRWVGSKVDTARRQAPSSTRILGAIAHGRSGKFEVRDAHGNSLGWLADKLDHGHFKLDKVHADTFTASLGTSGTTHFKEDTSNKYLAGHIKPGATLTSTSGFATLGLSSFGPPQVNNPGVSGDPSETATRSYDSSTGSVTGFWKNNKSPASSSIPLFIWYDNQAGGAFYLTGSSNPPTTTSNEVTFHFKLNNT